MTEALPKVQNTAELQKEIDIYERFAQRIAELQSARGKAKIHDVLETIDRVEWRLATSQRVIVQNHMAGDFDDAKMIECIHLRNALAILTLVAENESACRELFRKAATEAAKPPRFKK